MQLSDKSLTRWSSVLRVDLADGELARRRAIRELCIAWSVQRE